MAKEKKKIFTLANVLCLFVIISPLLDIASFLFRNKFNTSFSISTFIRPIIPVIMSFIIFFIVKGKDKLKLLAIFAIYVAYGLIHLYTTSKSLSGWSYGDVKAEMQYVLNFTFLIVYLVIFYIVFIKFGYTKKEENKQVKEDISKYDSKSQKVDVNKNLTSYELTDIEKLRKCFVISMFIYVVSIFIAILTKTSSYTYPETMLGYKGWIESGNSLSAILILSMFIVIEEIKAKNIAWKIFSIITMVMTAAYLATLIGTRTGILGVILVVGLFIATEILFSRNKKIIIAGIIVMIMGCVFVGVIGSKTLERRKEVNDMQNEIFDNVTGEPGCLTGDLLVIKNQILNNEVEDGYMQESQKKALIRTYEYCKAHNVKGTDSRKQQLVYNYYLVLEQKNPLMILFGNGFEQNFRELVMENEFASFAFNFGIIGFILCAGALLALLIYAFIFAIKNIKRLNQRYVMMWCALALTYLLSWMSGYIFFATSNMCVIVSLAVILINEIKKIKN